jgi:hypothetical protein
MTNPLSRMARAEEVTGFSRWVEMGIQAAGAGRPDALDRVNFDDGMVNAADVLGVRPTSVYSDDELATNAPGKAGSPGRRAASSNGAGYVRGGAQHGEGPRDLEQDRRGRRPVSVFHPDKVKAALEDLMRGKAVELSRCVKACFLVDEKGEPTLEAQRAIADLRKFARLDEHSFLRDLTGRDRSARQWRGSKAAAKSCSA